MDVGANGFRRVEFDQRTDRLEPSRRRRHVVEDPAADGTGRLSAVVIAKDRHRWQHQDQQDQPEHDAQHHDHYGRPVTVLERL